MNNKLISAGLLVLGIGIGGFLGVLYATESSASVANNSISQSEVASSPTFPTGAKEKNTAMENIEAQEEQIQAAFTSLLKEFRTSSSDPYSHIQRRNEAIVEKMTKYHELFPDYVDTNCQRHTVVFYGGTAASSLYLECVKGLNREYLEDLQYFTDTL